MYVRHAHVQHLKRIRDLRLDFEHHGELRMWTVLIGENGTAKTTILQAIALASAGSRQVNTLALPIVKHLRDRRGDDAMSIAVDFDFTPHSLAAPEAHPGTDSREGLGLRSEASLRKGSTSLEGHAFYTRHGKPMDGKSGDPLDAARDVHRPLWFVAGYGISRALPDSNFVPPLDLPSIERLRPLFDSQARLASSSVSNHFLQKDDEEGRKPGTTSRMYSRMLNEAIKLGGSSLLPDISKLELRGQGGAASAGGLIESDRFHQRMGPKAQRIAGVALSHGYQSTFAWIADLIGHVLLEANAELKTTEMEGLVLIDEIDLYLHPTWQATFIEALRRIFPRIQFVATTHSPIVLAGLSSHEVVRLIVDPDTGDVVRGAWDPRTGTLAPTTLREPVQPDPRPMTASEIYRIWFGIDRLTPNPLGEDLRRYRVLAEDPARTSRDTSELRKLRKRLIQAGMEDIDQPQADEEQGE
jgi:hypothetical protein